MYIYIFIYINMKFLETFSEKLFIDYDQIIVVDYLKRLDIIFVPHKKYGSSFNPSFNYSNGNIFAFIGDFADINSLSKESKNAFVNILTKREVYDKYSEQITNTYKYYLNKTETSSQAKDAIIMFYRYFDEINELKTIKTVYEFNI